MKKNSISRIALVIIAILLGLTTTNAHAGTNPSPLKYALYKVPHDTPYLALVQINLTGSTADTPYLSFSIQPELVYAQVASLLNRQPGLFHILIVFINKDEEVVGEDDYYVDHT